MATRSRNTKVGRSGEDAETNGTSCSKSNTNPLKCLSEPMEKIKKLAWRVVPFDALPSYLRDNEFLLHHHRPQMNSIKECIKSTFRMHTQTLNIWTHLIGFVFFVFLTLSAYLFRDYFTDLFGHDVTISDLPWEEQGILLFYFVGAMICLLCSTTFHTLSSHSAKVHLIVSRLDYTGIALLITGSSVPAYYYSFYCFTITRFLHTSMILTLCTSCIAISFWPKFSHPKYRPLRFAVFALFGLYGVVPSVHMALWKGVVWPYVRYVLGLVAMAVIYLSGGALYVLRIPERFFPGTFDVWAHSHQLFHLCVIAAALVHYDTLLFMIKNHIVLDDCPSVLFDV